MGSLLFVVAVEPRDGVFYLIEDGGEAAGMGGIRRLPDGSAEIAEPPAVLQPHWLFPQRH